MRALFAFLTLTLAALTATAQPPAPLKTFALPKHNNVQVKLGAKLLPPDKRKPVVRLAQFLATPINLPTDVDYWSSPAAITVMTEMYLNNQLGDCVIADKAHGIGLAAAAAGLPALVFPDNEIRATYFGFSPNDQGCVITEVLDAMRDQGFRWGGQLHKIDGYVSVNWSNRDQVKAAIYLFGPCTIGFGVPSDWINGAGQNVVWTPTNSQIEGGHDVCLCGYDAEGVFISTWGIAGSADKSRRPVKMRWDAFQSNAWVSEMYAELYPEWYAKANLSPTGLDVPGLRAALDAIKNGRIPDGPVQPPTPPPGPVNPPSPPNPPTPPVPVGPLVLDVTVSGHIPLFGTITLTGTGTQRTAQPATTLAADLSLKDWARVMEFIRMLYFMLADHTNNPAGQMTANVGINWTDLEKWLPIIVKELGIVAPVILADLNAGKPWGQIVADVIAALVKGGHSPANPNHFRAGYDPYRIDSFDDFKWQATGGEQPGLVVGVTTKRDAFAAGFRRHYHAASCPGVPDGLYVGMAGGPKRFHLVRYHPDPFFGAAGGSDPAGFANPIQPQPTTYPQAMPAAGFPFRPLNGYFANQFGGGAAGASSCGPNGCAAPSSGPLWGLIRGR